MPWLRGCDALVVITEWNEFKQLDKPRLRDMMRCPVLYDGRNIYEPDEMVKCGFIYRGVGRGYNAMNLGEGAEHNIFTPAE
jgi:UDPglucose 6-dehydrogenase